MTCTATRRTSSAAAAGRYYDFPYTNATILFPASAVQSFYGVVYNFEDPTCPSRRRLPGHQERERNLLPAGHRSAAAEPALGRRLEPRHARARDADCRESSVLRSGLARLLDRSQPLARPQLRSRQRPLPRHPVSLPRRTRSIRPPASVSSIRRHRVPSNFRIWANDGHAEYDGLNLGFHARAGSNFEASNTVI